MELSTRSAKFDVVLRRTKAEALTYIESSTPENIIGIVGRLQKADSVICADLLQYMRVSDYYARIVANKIVEHFYRDSDTTSDVQFFKNHYCGWPCDGRATSHMNEDTLRAMIRAFVAFNQDHMDRIRTVARDLGLEEMNKQDYVDRLFKEGGYDKHKDAIELYVVEVSESTPIGALKALCEKLQLPHMDLVVHPMAVNYLDILWLHIRGILTENLVNESVRRSLQGLRVELETRRTMLVTEITEVDTKIRDLQASLQKSEVSSWKVPTNQTALQSSAHWTTAN